MSWLDEFETLVPIIVDGDLTKMKDQLTDVQKRGVY